MSEYIALWIAHPRAASPRAAALAIDHDLREGVAGGVDWRWVMVPVSNKARRLLDQLTDLGTHHRVDPNSEPDETDDDTPWYEQ